MLRQRISLIGLAAFAAALMEGPGLAGLVTNFSAYNDCAWISGQLANNITTVNTVGVSNGLSFNLRSYESGATLPVQVKITGAIEQWGFSTNAEPTPGTDAYDVFFGQVTLATEYGQINPGQTVRLDFTNLNPNMRYTFAFHASRGYASTDYSNRWTDVVLASVDSFTNTSSPLGVRLTNVLPQDRTQMMGANTNWSLVRYDDIRPGADGAFYLTLTASGTNGQSRGYMNAFMLREISDAPSFDATHAPPIVINEIMYNPYAPWGSTNDAKFVELYNPGSVAVDLSDCRLEDDGVEHLLPVGLSLGAGQYLVLCDNFISFTNRYPTVSNYVSGYGLSLPGSGGTLELSRWDGSQWEDVDHVDYRDSGKADGDGPSLELVHPSFARADGMFHGAWADSLVSGGTPGQRNSIYTNRPAPVLGEVKHEPPRPVPGSAVNIRARAAGRDSDDITVFLYYRKDQLLPQSWNVLEMSDTGVNGDTTAGDGEYAARVPPPGQAAMTSGDLLEFKIGVFDSIGSRFYPATNTASVTNEVPPSYLVCFMDDAAYDGSYSTYYLTMSASNRFRLENQPDTFWNKSNDRLDCTLTTAEGDIYYNCGARYRGASSRLNYDVILGIHNPHSFNIRLPDGEEHQGSDTVLLNFLDGINQHVSMSLFRSAGKGVVAPNTELVRFWLNESNKTLTAWQGIYAKVQNVDRSFIGDHYDDSSGGKYEESENVRELIYTNSMAYYTNGYIASTQNTVTAWHEFTNMIWTLNQPPAALPTVLPTRVNIRNWARVFALHTVLGNNESGLGCSFGPSVDEAIWYCDPKTGLFDIIPWDIDAILTTNRPGSTIWDWQKTNSYSIVTPGVISNFLFNPPMVSWYVGDLADIATNLMSDSNFTALIDSLGTAVTPSIRSNYLTQLTLRRAEILSQISTQLTVNVNGSPALGSAVAITNVYSTANGWRGAAVLSGLAPQAYSAHILVNGKVAAGVNTRAATWNSATNVEFTLGGSNSLAILDVETANNNTSILRQVRARVVDGRTQQFKGGSILSNTVWSPTSGVVSLTGLVSLASGAQLTIQAGTVVLVPPGAGFDISSGTLRLLGTSTSLVHILPASGASHVDIAALGSGASVVADYASFVNTRLAFADGATGTLTDCTLDSETDTVEPISTYNAGAVTLRRCRLENFTRVAISATTLLVEDCLFQNPSLCGLDIADGTSTVRRSTFRHETAKPVASGLRFSGTALGLVSNIWINSLEGHGLHIQDSARVRVSHSVIMNVVTGLMAGSSAICSNYNNTIASSDMGIAGSSASTWNTIVWSNAWSITNAPGSVQYSDVELPGNSLQVGTGNINRDPLFRSAADGDLTLLAYSPLSTAGMAGASMGALAPFGASPVSPSLPMAVGLSPTSVQVSWQDNSTNETGFEIEHRIGSGAWSWLTSTAAGSTAFTHTNATPDTLHSYRIRSIHARGESLWTDPAALTTEMGDAQSSLRITELMYAPSGDSLAEFIELKNLGFTPLDLSGFQFTAGIDFVFPANTILAPGAFFVLVRDAASFAARYPAVTIHGVFQNGTGLNNSGEQLRLEDALGNVIFSFIYENGLTDTDWDSSTYQGGYSLVLLDPNGDLSGGSSWRASVNVHGSPGADDPASPYSGIVINEILAHTDPPLQDSIEIANTGTGTVNIAGWYLSDSPSDMRKYQIPSSPAINLASGACHVFYSSTSFGTAFQLSELGEYVYLSAASGTNLTGYRAWEKFEASENGVSMGRYIRSNGQYDFAFMSQRTLGTNQNGAPLVGPAVINEIMYNPLGGSDAEYLELYNPSASTVSLSSGTNGWRFNGAVEYVFPVGTVMSAYEHLLIVPTTAELFRSLTGVTSTAIRVFGPYSGTLANSEETVKFYKPGAIEPDGTVPLILVDRVKYQDSAPWPLAADGDGASLERRVALSYGNDATNWSALTIGGTPGATNNLSSVSSVIIPEPATSVLESNRYVDVSVRMSPASTGSVTVSYTVGGTASSGTDFSLNSGTLVFAPYETSRRLRIAIMDDATVTEADETVIITLTAVSSGPAILGGNKVHTLTIVDTDGGTLPVPSVQPTGVLVPFTNSLVVSMTTSVAGAGIYYTLDGTTPTLDSDLYTAPLTMTFSTPLKARIYKGSYMAGPVTSVWFTAQATQWNPGPDADNDGMDDAWETLYLGGTNAAMGQAGQDADADGHSNFEEYIAGTHPALAGSSFDLVGLTATGGLIRLEWHSVTGRVYSVYSTTNPSLGWDVWPLASELTGDAKGTNSLTQVDPSNRRFYRVTVSRPE